MIFFTSDLHYGHYNAINNRPFETVEEMNEVLLKNWNEKIRPNDTVYILGDLAFRTPIEKVNEFVKKLHGEKVLIKGSHDKNYDPSLFKEICDFKEIHVNEVSFSLMHYPMVEWPKSRYGSIHLHGHQHNQVDYNVEMRNQGIKRFDVGVDANEFVPVSVDEVLEFIKREKNITEKNR